MDTEGSSEPVNAYEAQRAARIAANRQRMAELGVLEAAQDLQAAQQPEKLTWRSTTQPKPRPAAAAEATRASKRVRGQPAPQADIKTQDQGASSSQAGSSKRKASQQDGPRFELTDTQYAAPFTLTSIGVTVLDLGQMYRGPFASNYWSSKGCLYRHAYPVGYRASKEVFGLTWDMEISAGEAGPVFTVSQRGGSRRFSGSSPTKPWTDVCLALRPSQRISGPLFFGFSDLHVQRALAALYNPAELRYALYGTPMTAPLPQAAGRDAAAAASAADAQQTTTGSSNGSNSQQQGQQGQPQPDAGPAQQQGQLSVAEAFAAELQSVRGIGVATAQALALTRALGGERHSSLQSLCRWLAADPQHPAQLQHFLLNSDEVPRCTRQLPSWREKWVPRILQQLSQLTESS